MVTWTAVHFCTLLLATHLQPALASTHWVVTEAGRIQTQHDSLFQMRRPYDLVALLHQEERAALVDSLKQTLISQKSDIDRSEDKETNVEKRLYSTDDDCLAAGKPLTELDLYVSTVLLFESRGIKVAAFEEATTLGKELQKPDCTAVVDLEFSMQTFEHLLAMQLRSNLTILPEVGLISALSKSDNVEEFGHNVYNGLTKNRTSWVLFNMAVYYWRTVGDAYNAMECVRRALHFSPSEYKDIALVNLANILHRAQHSEEAAIVAFNAVKNYPTNAVSLFALGNIYTVVAEYNKAVVCYKNALKYQPDFELAARNLRAVLCHRKLEQALEAQHNSLQRTLLELRVYQQQHEQWLRHQEKLFTEQATPEVRRESRLHYEDQKLRRSQGIQEKDCFQYHQDGHTFLSCSVKRESMKNSFDSKIDLSLNLQLLHAVESKAEKLEEAVAKQRNLKLKSESSQEGASNFSEPTKPSRYPKQPLPGTDTSSPVDALGADWPLPDDCIPKPRGLPVANEFPSVFLPPENKGFEVNKFLGELQNLKPLEEHPLPWFPPVCGQKESAEEVASSFPPGSRVRDQFPKLPDASLKRILLSYVDNDQSTEEEVGQRILTALKQSLGPSWLLYNMAALYWRVIGNVHNAIECLRRSLRTVSPEFADVPFVNYASLLHKMGLPDEALVLALKAFAFHEFEPETNFFLANMWTLKKNFTGAALHYKRVLQQNPTYPDAMTYLVRVSCHAKFHASPEETSTIHQQSIAMCPTIDLNTVVCTQNHCPNDEHCMATVRCFTHADWPDEDGFKACRLPNSKLFLAKKLEEMQDDDEYVQTAEEEVLTLLPPQDLQEPAEELETVHWESLVDSPIPPDQDDKPQVELAGKKMHLKVDVSSLPKSATIVTAENDPVVIRNQPVVDDPLPDVIATAKDRRHFLPPSLGDCHSLSFVNLKHFTSTWLSVSAKNVHIGDYVNMRQSVTGPPEEPHCDHDFPASALTLDHLVGVKHRARLVYAAEMGLKEAFQTLGREGEEPMPVDHVATHLASALQKNSSSWVLTTLAALYWRISGNADEAITCLRQALHLAPRAMRDIPLISLANVFHRAGLFNDALIVANMALETSPKFVVIHFTLANIYAAKGDLENAVAFYESTLSLQSSFEPAKDRLRSIYCGALLMHRDRNSETSPPAPSAAEP